MSSEFMKVLIAIDDSECSLYALRWALDNFAALRATSLVVFTAQPFPDVGSFTAAYLGPPATELIESAIEEQEDNALSLLEKAKEICSSKGAVAETLTEAGDPKQVICNTANKLNVDLLIMGSHGKGALERALIGSVSNYCVNNVHCPVLVVKKPPQTSPVVKLGIPNFQIQV